jgi:hypothetical protein
MQLARGVAPFVSVVSALALSLSSYAASVLPEQGIVLVNHGNGYQNATGPTTVKPGDIVVVNPGGKAWINYGDGCTVPVVVGSIVTVAAQSPCITEGSMTALQATLPASQGGAPPNADNPESPSGDVVPDTTGFGDLAIGVTVAGVAVGALLLTQPDKAASP